MEGIRKPHAMECKTREQNFEELCEWFETEMEHGISSSSQVYNKHKELDESRDKVMCYSKIWLKNKIQTIYGDISQFIYQNGQADVICLKDQADMILRNHQTNSDVDEKMKIIETAVKFYVMTLLELR